MVCPVCGRGFEGVAYFCPHCGSRIAPVVAGVGPAAAVGYGMPMTMRVQRNLQLLGVLWSCFAVFRLISGLAGMFALRLMAHGGWFGHSFPFDPSHNPFFAAMVPFTLVMTLAMTGLTALVAYGLMQRRPWGRTLAIVMSILSLLKFPLGTALGIYTLWVLAPADSATEFEAIADRTRPGF